MGRRSLKTTKAGKFMNPTDQYRKEQRRKELKKNKKQRQIVREAVLRMKDVGQMLQEIEDIERQELETLGQAQYNEKGLEEKKSKLHASIHRVARYYQQEDPKKAQELKLLIMESEQRRRETAQVYNSYRAARSQYAVEDIPMPDSVEGGLASIPMPAASSLTEEYKSYPSATEVVTPPPPPPGSPPPDVVEYDKVIETPVPVGPPAKSVRFMDLPPVAAVEVPPQNSAESAAQREDSSGEDDDNEDSDNEDDDDDDDDDDDNDSDEAGPGPSLAKSVLEKAEEVGKSMAQEEGSMHGQPLGPPSGPPTGPPTGTTGPPTTAPPPPLFPQPFPPTQFGFPPGLPHGPPPGFDAPMPPRPLLPPQIPSGAILSAPPTRVQQDKSESSSVGSAPNRSAIISAQPQLRNMTAEVTKFMPTSLRVRRDHPKTAKPKLKVNSEQEASRQTTAPRTHTAAMHVQGDAYDTFMHEMQGLL